MNIFDFNFRDLDEERRLDDDAVQKYCESARQSYSPNMNIFNFNFNFRDLDEERRLDDDAVQKYCESARQSYSPNIGN